MKKLPIKDKIFWKNFFSFILFFLLITFLFAYIEDDNGQSIGFIASYTFTSIFCVLYVGVKIGQEFSKCEDIDEKRDEYLKKENITIKEFREKYKDIINIYDSSENWPTEDTTQKNDIYEYINEAGEKTVLTWGRKDKGKFDIYWEDILASKNNIKEIKTDNGYIVVMSDFDPSEATDFINKVCPLCGCNVDRFFYIQDFSKKDEDYGDARWMEFCFKCNKLIYLETGRSMRE